MNMGKFRLLLGLTGLLLLLFCVPAALAQEPRVNVTEVQVVPSLQIPGQENGNAVIYHQPDLAAPTLHASETCTKPPPILLEPPDSANLDTLIPTYLWEVVSDTYDYRFQLALSDTFTEVYDSWGIRRSPSSDITQVTFLTYDNLEPETTYYWRVASNCEYPNYGRGEYSSPFSFHSGPPTGTILSPPTLLAPEDGAAVGSTRVVIRFEEVSGAEYYDVRSTESITDRWHHAWLFPAPRSSSTIYVDPESTIYWWMRSRNDYAWSEPAPRWHFTTPPVTATTTIEPRSGGTFTPTEHIAVQFPPGAVTSTTTLSYTLQPYPKHSLANFRFGGRAFTLVALGATGMPVTTFEQSFTMTIVYNSADLLYAAIENPYRLNLVYWDGSQWQYILPCAGCSIDPASRKVTIVLNHLTEFALIAPREYYIYLPLVLKAN